MTGNVDFLHSGNKLDFQHLYSIHFPDICTFNAPGNKSSLKNKPIMGYFEMLNV